MSEQDAKQAIAVAMMLTATVSIGNRMLKRKEVPSFRIFVGIFAAGFLLSVMAKPAPELAGPFAVSLSLAAIFQSDKLLDRVVQLSRNTIKEK